MSKKLIETLQEQNKLLKKQNALLRQQNELLMKYDYLSKESILKQLPLNTQQSDWVTAPPGYVGDWIPYLRENKALSSQQISSKSAIGDQHEEQ